MILLLCITGAKDPAGTQEASPWRDQGWLCGRISRSGETHHHCIHCAQHKT